jgi:ABC-type glycerol-3-phosphate transport system permease component
LAQNIDVKSNTTVNAGTYIGFIVLMGCGCILALSISNANDVIREDGTRVVLMKNPTWQSEFVGLWETFTYEPSVILLFPMFWSSNWFYTYQQNGMNAIHFGTRTRALNSCLYYIAQIVGAMALGFALDYQGIRRSVRAKLALAFLFVMTMVIWGGGYAYQKGYTRATITDPHFQPTDWEDDGYVAPMFLYFFYGLFDALWQAAVYW